MILAAAAVALSTFIDPLIESKMAAEKIPGAVFVHFKDGRVDYAKGYGYANVERKTRVSPEKTIWRIGSISKVFTATALMQFDIDLDKSANAYLKSLQTDPRVTPRMLLDHTAGFDEIRPGTQQKNVALERRQTKSRAHHIERKPLLKRRFFRLIGRFLESPPHPAKRVHQVPLIRLGP